MIQVSIGLKKQKKKKQNTAKEIGAFDWIVTTTCRRPSERQFFHD